MVEAALLPAAFSNLASSVETELCSAGAQNVKIFTDWGERQLAYKLKKLELIQCYVVEIQG